MAGNNINFLEKSLVKLNFTEELTTAYGGLAMREGLFGKPELKERLEEIFPRGENFCPLSTITLRYSPKLG
jgi:hypothetical protein